MELAELNGQEILNRLTKLQSDMNFLKEHVEDVNLSDEDKESIRLAERELKEGKTISLEDLKKELEENVQD